MIYKDKGSIYDTENYPGIRPSPCIQCGYASGHHCGWQCPDSGGIYSLVDSKTCTSITEFGKLPPDRRFLTQEMKDSISPASTGVTVAFSGYDPARIVNAIREQIDEIGVQLNAKKNSVERSIEKTKDISDWRSWRHDQPGNCACGIARIQCTYHKG